MRINLKLAAFAFMLSVTLTNLLWATDGYFSNGYGVKQMGQGGAGVALPADSLAAATNPAGMVIVGNRFDFGVSPFIPDRSGTIIGNQLPPGYPDVNDTYDANGKQWFFMPELGYNRMIKPWLSLGVSMYGNGGMNTSYVTPIPLLGTTNAGVDLEQMFIAPTVSLKVSHRNSIGISFNVAYQRFEALGLQNFANANYSVDPGNVTNRGYDSSFGGGFRVGWLGEVNSKLSLGATYQSRTWMGNLDKYRGLFAEYGAFDIPANFAGGIAVKPLPRTTLLLDVERILYGSVKSIANPGASPGLLGSANGPGFGWHDVTAPKIGVNYALSRSLTLRGGYNHSDVPFGPSETFFNLLAPGIVQSHITGGASVALGKGRELNFAYMHAFANAVNGVNSIPPAAGGGNANLRMFEDSFGISFGWSRE
ncbi:MAG TPA: outer membrane protein transport protein [Terriglobia bacterium]|nr:outer membrane protein transport protein [Terriglobia bacterium]